MKNGLFGNGKFTCYGCGKIVQTFNLDMQRYAYKVSGKKFCCYKCYNQYLCSIDKKSKNDIKKDLKNIIVNN